MEKRSGDPLRIFVLLYRERVRLSSPQRGKKSLVQRTFFRDFIKTAHRGCGAQYSLSRNLVAFAPAGAKKVRSFSPATCAAEKIPLRLQVWNLCAGGAQIMRAADCSPFVKKQYFLTVLRRQPGHPRLPPVFCSCLTRCRAGAASAGSCPRCRPSSKSP